MKQFKIIKSNLQITFYHRLQEIRETCLLDALLSVILEPDIPTIDEELSVHVSKEALRRMAGWGLRGEIVFPVPYVLRASPELLGYYRLLLGFSQKQFYSSNFGFGPLKGMGKKADYQRIMQIHCLNFVDHYAPARNFSFKGLGNYHGILFINLPWFLNYVGAF